MDNTPFKTDVIEIKGKTKSGKMKVVRYDRSFLSRLMQNARAKGFYDTIKNYCLSFERVKPRSSWGAESFLVGSEAAVRLTFVGGALAVCMALDPAAYNQKDYPHADFSEHREYKNTPLMVPVRNNAELKLARRLIGDAFTSHCVYTVDFPVRTDYIAELPAKSDDALIKKGLIKVTKSELSEADAKKALAAALRAEAEEEKLLEEIGSAKKRKSKKPEEEIVEEIPAEESTTGLSEEAAEQPASEQKEEPVAAEAQPIAEEEKKPRFAIGYDRSFIARIIQNEKAKRFYGEIKNYCLSFGMKSRLSWRAETFYYGRKSYLCVKVHGKTLCLYFALDPANYDESIYHHKDLSDKCAYRKTPMLLRVRSELWLRKAKLLIAEMLVAAGFTEKETPWVDYVALYPFEETKALIEKKLIKEVALKAGQGSGVSPEDVLFEVEEDEEEIDFEMEEEPVEEEEKTEPTVEGEPTVEDVEFELAEQAADSEEEPEEIEFELAEEAVAEGEEEIDFEFAGDAGEEDSEDVSFELAEDLVENAQGMESYGVGEKDGNYVTLRKYVRGFTAKMKQGDQERKEYYAEIKATLLSFKGVKCKESFSGDTFKKGARILLKSRIRGKTLCLFFALDVDNYKQTIYRQQYKGDTKAYAMVPMMVRVKSDQALKRAIRLIEEMERNYSLQREGDVDLLAIRKSYLFEETPALVEQGLIKTRLVTVSQYEAEELLKKKAK